MAWKDVQPSVLRPSIKMIITIPMVPPYNSSSDLVGQEGYLQNSQISV